MNDQPSQEALDLRSYFRPIWRRKWLVLTITVLAVAATYYLSSRESKTYTSRTKVYITAADPTLDLLEPGGSGPPSVQQLTDAAQLMTARSITNGVARQLGSSFARAGTVSVSQITGSSFLVVTAQGGSPALTAQLANAYVAVFLAQRRRSVAALASQQKQAALASAPSASAASSNPALETERESALQEAADYGQIVLAPSAGAQQVNPAVPAAVPTSPTPKRDAIFGGVVGLVLGVIAAFCLELLDRRLVSVSKVESMFGRPILAVLPRVSDPTPLEAGEQSVIPPEFVEELRSLKVILRLGSGPEPPRVIMITSALPEEGKSTIARDLALVYAESGERVLVIDGDMRRPSMERMFAIKSHVGLSQVLRGEAQLSDAVFSAKTIGQPLAEVSKNGRGPAAANGDKPDLLGSVDVLGHGEIVENPLVLTSSQRMTELLEDTKRRYDIVILDTPPVLTVADSVPLLEVVDTVLLVVRLGQTTRQAAVRFRRLVHRLPNVSFAGVIANDRRAGAGDEGYGSYGSYGYQYETSHPRARKVPESVAPEPSRVAPEASGVAAEASGVAPEASSGSRADEERSRSLGW
jgi:Mrp family chromosome partitioning ATPase